MTAAKVRPSRANSDSVGDGGLDRDAHEHSTNSVGGDAQVFANKSGGGHG